MNLTEQGIARYVGVDGLKYLQSVRVGVAGCGGLGSNCAVALVRSGFKRLVLADFDLVDETNLNRQAFDLAHVGWSKVEALAEVLLRINPDLDLGLHKVLVDQENGLRLFAECHAVVEAFDAASAKKMLAEVMVPSGRFYVSGSGMGGFGNSDAITTRRVSDTFYLVGDMVTECNVETPPQAPRVLVAAAKQADVVLAYFLNEYTRQAL